MMDTSRNQAENAGAAPAADASAISLGAFAPWRATSAVDLRKRTRTRQTPLSFLVIAPTSTPQSIKLAHQYNARTNWDIALVTAEGLKHLAERWTAQEPDKPFPVRLLSRTELIDKERAEFLLSLA